MRIFAVSDVHADYTDNRRWLGSLSASEFTGDALVVAGDISHSIVLLEEVLTELRSRYRQVFFVPGNHDLWLRSEGEDDSLAKLGSILGLCRDLDVSTGPAVLGDVGDEHPILVVPLLSWYERPEHSGTSLYVPKRGEDPDLSMWVDNWAIRWPGHMTDSDAARHMAASNEPLPTAQDTSRVMTFSHFLPRRELMFRTAEEISMTGSARDDPSPPFNFSRVAGSSLIETQLRDIGSMLHVYGHQHRNRIVRIDGVTYVSCCLGYPRERDRGVIKEGEAVPMLLWDTHRLVTLAVRSPGKGPAPAPAVDE